MILSCRLTLERSLNLRSSPTRLVLLQYKSTQLTVQQHHEGKIVLDLGSILFLRLVNNYNFCCPPDLNVILLQQCFPRWTCPWYLPCVFTQEVASNSTQITVVAWIRGFPQIMIVENVESTESAITFTAHSTDSDNKVLSLEKENCTHGTLCSFPSVGI